MTHARLFAAVLFLTAAHPALAQDWREKPTYGTFPYRSGGAPPAPVNLQAGGAINTRLGGVGAWVPNAPHVRVNYQAGSGNGTLVFRAESDVDTTLLVNLPDGSWLANDNGAGGINPLLQFPNPRSGQYDIWIGAKNPNTSPAATFIATELGAGPARAGTQYAVVAIENRTGKHTVRYRFRWGEDGAWSKTVFLKPGQHMTHSQAVPPAGNRPVPQITFEKGIDIDLGMVARNLESNLNNGPTEGKGYHFVATPGDDTRDFIELALRTKREEMAAFKINTAILNILAGAYSTAVLHTTEALLFDPNSMRAYAVRGRARYMANDFDGALRDWGQGLRLAPTDTELHLFRGDALYKKRRYDRVVEECNKALENDPFSAAALGERAAASFHLLNYDQAVADANKAIRLDPTAWLAVTTLGKVDLAHGRPKEAADRFTQALALFAGDYEPYAGRGQAYEMLGDFNLAFAEYQKAAKLGMRPGYKPFQPAENAWKDLDNYPLGKFATPAVLKQFNLEDFEVDPPYRANVTNVLPLELQALVAGEWARFRAMKFEATAAVNRFLRAAKMTEAERRKQGLELDWYYGPVTSPVARFRSGDDLGGLRVIGHLKQPDGKELSMIFAVTYQPPTGNDLGKTGLLFDGDNCRLQVRLHNTGEMAGDYFFQSFGAYPAANPTANPAGNPTANGKLVMRPGFYLDETTGALTNDSITASSLSTRCIHCHNKGFAPSARLIEQLKMTRSNNPVAIGKIEEIRKFVELAHVYGAGRNELKQIEASLIKGGPSAVVPIDDLYEANRQAWLEIYPQYIEMRRNPEAYLNPYVPPPKTKRLSVTPTP